MKTVVCHGGIQVIIEPIKKDISEKRKIQNPSLKKAQKILTLIASHC